MKLDLRWLPMLFLLGQPTRTFDYTVRERLEKQQKILDEILVRLNSLNKPEQKRASKDIWDKLAAASTLVVAIVGGIFTFCYHQDQQRLSQIEIFEKYVTLLVDNDKESKRELAMFAIADLGYQDLLDRSLNYFPSSSNIDALFSLAQKCKLERKTDEEYRICRRIVSVYEQAKIPEDAKLAAALEQIGLYLLVQNQNREAEKQLKRAITILRSNPFQDPLRLIPLLQNLSYIAAKEKRFQEAADLREDLLLFLAATDKSRAQVADAMETLSETYKALGNKQKADDLRVGAAITYANAGETAAGNNDFSKANHLFEKAIELDQSKASFRQSRAQFYVKAGQYRNAETDFLRAIELDQSNAVPVILLGDLYFNEGKTDLAILKYSESLEIVSSPMALEHRARAYESKGNTIQAAQDRLAAESMKTRQNKVPK